MNEGWGTSANKTHLFNWLYNMTVQMAQRVGVCILNICVRVMSTVFPFICDLTVSRLITTVHGYTPEMKQKSLIRKKALLLLARI